MGQILILFVFYAICASAVLVWSTLLDDRRALRSQMSLRRIEYVAIPDHSFFELAEQHPNLVIFDVHSDRGVNGWSEFISYWLPISALNLPGVLKWLPPASIVVLCCKDAAEQLDARTNTILLQVGIGTVYFLDDSSVVQADRSCASHVTARAPNRELHNGDGSGAPLVT
jgi:hypothetical protein